MKYFRYIYILFVIIIFNCAGNQAYKDDSNVLLENALILFNKQKFSKAQEKFEFIIYNNPGSTSALKSQYYVAECLYNLESYSDASKAYDKYIMLSQDSD